MIAARFPWRRYGAGDVFAAEVWLVNDGPRAHGHCRAAAVLDGQTVWAQEEVRAPAAGAACIGSFAVSLAAPPGTLDLQLTCRGQTLAANRYDLRAYLPGRQPLRPRLMRWLADRLLGS